MEVLGESCKLCLKYIQGDQLIPLDDKNLEKLLFLQTNLDQSEDNNFLCKECKEKVENAFNFKSHLVNSIEYTESEANRENIPSTSTCKTSTEKDICHLCKNYVDRLSVISLKKFLKDDNMMEVFQGHIQELDIKNIEENWKVCEVCQKSLASFSTLVTSWLIANEWTEVDAKEDLANFEMVEVKDENIKDNELFVNSGINTSTTNQVKSIKEQLVGAGAYSISTKIKSENGEISDSSQGVPLNIGDVKKEESVDNEDSEMSELQLKNEEIDIKDEDGRKEGKRKRVIVVVVNGQKLFKCHDCSFTTKYRSSLHNHSLRHKNIDELEFYKCTECTFETKYKYHFKKHILIHRRFDEVETYKCHECDYVAKFKHYLKQHAVIHEKIEEVNIYKCQQCPYTTKLKIHLIKHEKVHKRDKKVQLYKCNQCDYVTKFKPYLKQHFLVHQNFDKITTFKCTDCPFITKRKGCLEAHAKTHRNLEEVQTFRCQECDYVTKFKRYLKIHASVHQTIEERAFKCEECPFTTSRKGYLKWHRLVHKSFEEVQTYKCPHCSYVGKKPRYLRTHLLIHKNNDEVPTFRCEQCPYVTKIKGRLRSHALKHKSLNEIKTFKCADCSYVAKRKISIIKHVEVHTKSKRKTRS